MKGIVKEILRTYNKKQEGLPCRLRLAEQRAGPSVCMRPLHSVDCPRARVRAYASELRHGALFFALLHCKADVRNSNTLRLVLYDSSTKLEHPLSPLAAPLMRG